MLTLWIASLVGRSLRPCDVLGVLLHQHDVVEREEGRKEQDLEDLERRRQNERLLDMYGDRSSLESLEKAAQFYNSTSSSNKSP